MVLENASIYTLAEMGTFDQFMAEYKSDFLHSREMGSSLLHLSIEGENFDIAAFLIHEGIDVNMLDSEGRTPLHLVCWTQNIKLAQSIIESGVDINVCDRYGNPAIWTAAFNSKGRYYDMVLLLMQYDPIVTYVNEAGITVLDLAKRFEDVKLLDMLLKK